MQLVKNVLKSYAVYLHNQILTSVRTLSLTSVTPTQCVPTLKAHMSAAAVADTLEMEGRAKVMRGAKCPLLLFVHPSVSYVKGTPQKKYETETATRKPPSNMLNEEISHEFFLPSSAN